MHFKTCQVCGCAFRTPLKFGGHCASCKEQKESLRLAKLRVLYRGESDE